MPHVAVRIVADVLAAQVPLGDVLGCVVIRLNRLDANTILAISSGSGPKK